MNVLAFVILSAAAGSMEERAVYARLLNSTSLVEILPLLAMGAATTMMSAPGGPTGMLSGITSGIGNIIPKSHKDRRRKKDTTPACESKAPMDTTDADCYTARWNLMVGYFPAHTGLKRMDQKIVQSVDEMNVIWSTILTNLSSAERAINSTDGLRAEMRILDNALGTLTNTSAAGVARIMDAQLNFSQQAKDDMRSIKEFLANAFGALKNQTNSVMAAQEGSQKGNAENMNNHASAALRDAVDLLLSEQKRMVGDVRAGGEAFIRLQNELADESKSVVAATRSLDNQIADTNTKVETGTKEWGEEVTGSAIESAVDWIDTNATLVVDKRLEMKLNQMTLEAERAGDGLVKEFDDEMHAAVSSTVRRGTRRVGGADAAVKSTLKDGVVLRIDQAANNVSAQVDWAEAAITNRTRDVESASGDVESLAGTLAHDADPGSIKIIVSDISADAENQVALAQRRTVSSKKDVGIDSLLAALRDAQADSHAGLSTSEAEYGDLVANLMALVGISGSEAGKLFGAIAEKVQGGQLKSLSDIKAQVARVLGQSQERSSLLMGNVSDASGSLGVLELNVRRRLQDSQQTVAQGLLTGASAVDGALDTLATNATGDNLKSQIRAAAQTGTGRVAGLAAGAQWVAQSIGGTGSVKQASYGLAHGDQDTTELFSSSLAKQDDFIIDQVSGKVESAFLHANQTVSSKSDLERISSQSLQALDRREADQDALMSQLKDTETRNLHAASSRVSFAAPIGMDTGETKAVFDSAIETLPNKISFANFTSSELLKAKTLLSEYLGSISLDISERTPESRDFENVLKKQNLLLGQVGSGHERIESKLVELLAMLAVPENAEATDRLRVDLQEAKSLEMQRLTNLTDKVTVAIKQVPLALNLSHILELTPTGEAELSAERAAAAAGGLDVLSQMEHVLAGGPVTIGTLNETRGDVSTSAAAVSSALSAVDIDTLDVKGVGRSLTTIGSELGLVVNGTWSALSADRAQVGLVGALALAAARERASDLSNRTSLGFNGSVRLLQSLDQQRTADWERVSALLSSVASSVGQSTNWISAGTDMLQLVSNRTSLDEVMSTQIYFTRLGLEKFLALWNEMAAKSSNQLYRLNKQDEEFVASLENELKTELMKDEDNIKIGIDKVHSFNKLIRSANSSLTEWDERVNTLLVGPTVDALPANMTSAAIDHVVDFYHEYQGNQTRAIQALMDAFMTKATR